MVKKCHLLKSNQKFLNKKQKAVNKTKQSELNQNKFWIKSLSKKDKFKIKNKSIFVMKDPDPDLKVRSWFGQRATFFMMFFQNILSNLIL